LHYHSFLLFSILCFSISHTKTFFFFVILYKIKSNCSIYFNQITWMAFKVEWRALRKRYRMANSLHYHSFLCSSILWYITYQDFSFVIFYKINCYIMMCLFNGNTWSGECSEKDIEWPIVCIIIHFFLFFDFVFFDITYQDFFFFVLHKMNHHSFISRMHEYHNSEKRDIYWKKAFNKIFRNREIP